MLGVSAPVSGIIHDVEVHVGAVDPEADVKAVDPEADVKDAEGAKVDEEEELLAIPGAVAESGW
jgi:hypothetical protein